MRAEATSSSSLAPATGRALYPHQQHSQQQQYQPPHSAGGGGGGPALTHLGPDQLNEMAHRQQSQIEAQQQMLVAKEQRLKYLRQQDYKRRQMASEYERLRRLREKVEAQELKLRKLRALRGNSDSGMQRQLQMPASKCRFRLNSSPFY